jgi:hypothetical protein
MLTTNIETSDSHPTLAHACATYLRTRYAELCRALLGTDVTAMRTAMAEMRRALELACGLCGRDNELAMRVLIERVHREAREARALEVTARVVNS